MPAWLSYGSCSRFNRCPFSPFFPREGSPMIRVILLVTACLLAGGCASTKVTVKVTGDAQERPRFGIEVAFVNTP